MDVFDLLLIVLAFFQEWVLIHWAFTLMLVATGLMLALDLHEMLGRIQALLGGVVIVAVFGQAISLVIGVQLGPITNAWDAAMLGSRLVFTTAAGTVLFGALWYVVLLVFDKLAHGWVNIKNPGLNMATPKA